MSQYDAYKQTIKQTAPPRDVEYRLIAQVTAALVKVKDTFNDSGADPTRMSAVMDALNWNNQVWDTFVEDVGSEGNALPRELRAAIVSLGIWVSRETNDVIAGKGDIAALISVNQAIMRGLKPETRGQSAPGADADADADVPPPPPAGSVSVPRDPV